MSKGSQTTTTSTAPNPQAEQDYATLLASAGEVAATPYQAYQGQLVAPTNQQQQTGIGTVNQYATAGVPYLQTAEGLQQSAANPLTAGQIQNYQSPYTQDVINATMANFANTNAQQQQQVLGNAAAQGALGGDRTGVAQAVLAGQQQQAEAPTIAGLENTGYGQAVNLAMQQYQQNPEQAAYGIASTGNAIENAGLTGANAQVGAGTLEQQTQQAQDTAAYQQFEQALQYPFATLGWEAGIDTGVGSQMGGTSQTTAPPPNYTAQLIGAGIGTGAAVLSDERAKENLKKVGKLNDGQSVYRFNYKGDPTTRIGLVAQEVERDHPEAVHQTNGWKSVDYDEATKDAVRRLLGGRVQGLATGGAPYGASGSMPYSAGIGWVPTMNITGGAGAPKPPGAPNQQQQSGIQSPAQMATNAAKIASSPGIGSAFNTGTTELASGMNASDLSALTGEDADVSSAALAALPFGAERGGRIAYGGLAIPRRNAIHLRRGGMPVRAGLGMASFMPRRKFADGGSPDDDVVNFPSDRFVQPPVPAGLYNNSEGDANPLENILKFQTYGQASPYAPAPSANETPRTAAGDELPPEITQGRSSAGPQAGIGTSAMSFADDGSRNAAPAAAPDSVNAAPAAPAPSAAPASQKGFGLLGLLSPDIGMSALSAGLGMMASRSPFLGEAIGQGGLQGLSTYGQLQTQHLAQQKQQQDVDLKVRELDQQAKAEQDRISQESKKEQFAETQMTPAQKAEADFRERNLQRENLAPVKIGQDVMGRDVLGVRNPNGNGYLDPTTMQPIDPSRISSSAPTASNAGAPGGPLTQPKIGALPPRDEAIAQQIAHYEIPPPSSFALAKPNSPAPMWLARADEISRAENNGDPYDSTQFGMRNKAVKDFGTGTQGKQITFFNNAVQHLGTLDGLINAMGSGDVQLINRARQAFQNQFGQEAPGNFDAAKNIVGQEIVKAIVANGGGEAERQAAAATLAAAKSPEQLRGILNTYKELAGAQLRDLKVQYENSTGLHNFEKKLIPESQAELAKIEARAKANNAPGAPAGTPVASAAAPPVPGAKLYQGKWYTRGPNGEPVPVTQ
jgi:hypothetical protein